MFRFHAVWPVLGYVCDSRFVCSFPRRVVFSLFAYPLFPCLGGCMDGWISLHVLIRHWFLYALICVCVIGIVFSVHKINSITADKKKLVVDCAVCPNAHGTKCYCA